MIQTDNSCYISLFETQVVIIDVLRRAGAEVTVASVEDTLQVRSILPSRATLQASCPPSPQEYPPRLCMLPEFSGMACRSTCPGM